MPILLKLFWGMVYKPHQKMAHRFYSCVSYTPHLCVPPLYLPPHSANFHQIAFGSFQKSVRSTSYLSLLEIPRRLWHYKEVFTRSEQWRLPWCLGRVSVWWPWVGLPFVGDVCFSPIVQKAQEQCYCIMVIVCMCTQIHFFFLFRGHFCKEGLG